MLPRFVRWILSGRVALTLLGCIAATGARGTTYYVATNGSDSNLGTNLTIPFLTIEHAAGKMAAGDTCLIRGGVYHETLAPAKSGLAEAPVTFAAYSNEVAIVDAAAIVTGWTFVTNGVYEASSSWTLGPGNNEVFVDGALVHEAQVPAFGGGDVLHPALASVSISGNTPNVISSPAWGGKPDNYLAGAWFVGGVGYSWAWQSAQVLSSTGNSVTLDPSTETPNWWFTGNGAGYLFGISNMLASDNQWFFQTNGGGGNALYLRITGGADPSSHLVERKQRLWCVNYNNLSHIVVSGLNLWGGAVNLSGNSNVLENCQARYLSHYTLISQGYLENGGVPQGGGVVVNGNFNTVRGCAIYDTAGSGILTSGVSNLVTRNTIYNTDYSGTYASALNLHGNADMVTFNTAYASGRDIIRPEGIGAVICFNDLSNPGLLDKDLGVLYCWGIIGTGVNGQPTRVAYNWMHDNGYPTPAPLVYLDDWDAGYQVDHNVIWDSGGDAGVRINAPATDIQVYNNTLFNCGQVGINTADSWPNSNPVPSFWTNDIDQYSASNTLYFAGSPAAQLVNVAQRNFSLKPNAPAIDAGVVIPGITDNYVGKAPDLGAYEFGAPAWTAGVASRPTLLVKTSTNGALALTAGPDAAFYQLLSATNLSAAGGWTPATNKPVVSGNLWSVTLPTDTATAHFYRLQAQ